MAENIKVFVSYKKSIDPYHPSSGTLDTDDEAPDIALKLAEKLEKDYKFSVFLDRKILRAGVDWSQTIYDNIHESDVLIVLLQAETARSDWVQREVDVARGAHVSILPLPIEKDVNLEDSVKRLALSSIQYFEAFTGSDKQYETLRRDIERLSKRTRTHQHDWQSSLRTLRQLEPAESTPIHTTYPIYDKSGNALNTTVCISTGDLITHPDIDVLVNSENDYMQMARIFETGRVSSALRYAGSHIVKGRIFEDTVQKELNEQITYTKEFAGIPVMLGQVIPTHAGHDESRLVKRNRARFILHVASMYVNRLGGANNLLALGSDMGIGEAVINTLETVQTINRQKGMIAPKGTDRAKTYDAETLKKSPEDGGYQPIKSIIFPLFGTGHGGRSVAEVVSPMVKTIRNFLIANVDNPDILGLERVHISVYYKPHIAIVNEKIKAILAKPVSIDDTPPVISPPEISLNPNGTKPKVKTAPKANTKAKKKSET